MRLLRIPLDDTIIKNKVFTRTIVKKGRVAISVLHAWKNDLLGNTNIQLIDPTASEMIDSTLLRTTITLYSIVSWSRK